MKRGYSFGSVGGYIFAAATAVQRTTHPVTNHRGWIALAAAVALLASGVALWSTIAQPAATPAPAPGGRPMTPEQIRTLPAQIQDQVRGIPQVAAAAKPVAPAEGLRWEEIIIAPARIQDQLRGTGSARTSAGPPPSTALRPEVLRSFPAQVQEQIGQGAEAGRQKAGKHALRPETIMALPPRIQAQVQQGRGTGGK